jgi:hypothetical protein
VDKADAHPARRGVHLNPHEAIRTDDGIVNKGNPWAVGLQGFLFMSMEYIRKL